MNHQGTRELETQRLLLRPFREDDAEAMFRNWASDPEVTRYLTWPTHDDPAFTRTLAAQWEESSRDPAFYQWAVVPKDLGEPIGSLSVVRTDASTESMELGYCLGRAWWGQGLMTEAVRAVVGYLFAEVTARRGKPRLRRGHAQGGDDEGGRAAAERAQQPRHRGYGRLLHPQGRVDRGAIAA